MDEVLARHRKEGRDLQSQITQKKKSATKKTRKSVNDECTKLEHDLKEKQMQEIAELDGATDAADEDFNNEEPDGTPELPVDPTTDETSLEQKTEQLYLSGAQSESQPRKGNRQKARLARRAAEQEALSAQAAEEAANLPNLKERERQRMVEEFQKRGLKEKEVAANGHCMYSAVADQMRQLGLGLEPDTNSKGQHDGAEVNPNDYKIVRRVAAEYMASNSDDFIPFLEEPLDDYLHKIKDTGEWGGQLELLALAKSYGIDINVLQGDGRVEKVEGGAVGAKNIWLAYYRHGFGLGEHYNSLRTKEATTSTG